MVKMEMITLEMVTIFRTHLTKQDSKELRVGKERVSSLDFIDNGDELTMTMLMVMMRVMMMMML